MCIAALCSFFVSLNICALCALTRPFSTIFIADPTGILQHGRTIFEFGAAIAFEPVDWILTGRDLFQDYQDDGRIGAANIAAAGLTLLPIIPNLNRIGDIVRMTDTYFYGWRHGDNVAGVVNRVGNTESLSVYKFSDQRDVDWPDFKSYFDDEGRAWIARQDHMYIRTHYPQDFIDTFVQNMQHIEDIRFPVSPTYRDRATQAGSSIPAYSHDEINSGSEQIFIGTAIRDDANLFVTLIHENLHIRLSRRSLMGSEGFKHYLQYSSGEGLY